MDIDKNWSKIEPTVDTSSEFFEIVNDFGSPLELVREAISNAIDWKATYIKISFEMKDIDGVERLIIDLIDDGKGMSEKVLKTAFWGLGHSQSRILKKNGVKNLIGEKGHGTKIFLRSEQVKVITKSEDKIFESVCNYPFKSLSNNKVHEPEIREISNEETPDFSKNLESGTCIRIIGYNQNERASFIQDIVKDYILWFTKIGSIERIFDFEKNKDFKVQLKCLDVDIFEEIPFGHIFPKENSNIYKLFEDEGVNAADYYVKRYKHKNIRLTNHPEVIFDLIVSVEGDVAKKNYNLMIRPKKGDKRTGTYRVSDVMGYGFVKIISQL